MSEAERCPALGGTASRGRENCERRRGIIRDDSSGSEACRPATAETRPRALSVLRRYEAKQLVTRGDGVRGVRIICDDWQPWYSSLMKPQILYHASSDTNIDVFEPRAINVRDPNEGPRIFATPSKAMATIFLVNTDDSWANSGSQDGTPYMAISDETRFKDLDCGGAIYSLPVDNFENDPEKGLGPLEWTSAVSVIPTGKELFSSGLDAMVDAGVQVYFMNQEMYRKLRLAPDHGISLLNTLISENQKLNKNVVHPLETRTN